MKPIGCPMPGWMSGLRVSAPSISPHSARRVYLLATVLALLCGMVIYAFFRNINDIVLFHFFPKPGFLNRLPLHVNTDNFVISAFVFQGTDVLWLLSGLFLIRSIWLANKKWMHMYISFFFIIVIANEIIQISPNIPGTFDVFDLLFLGITAFLESVIYFLFIHRRIK